MIASLRGTLATIGTGTCVVEVGGVGYLTFVSSHTLQAFPPVGGSVFLHTRQVVREDAVLLFGFDDPDELRLFDLLIAVSGVGPKLALALLSGLKPAALARAIRQEQVGALVAVPGIGRKTAERVIVELRDKLETSIASPREPVVLPGAERYQDAVAALTRLGYTPAQAKDSVRLVSESGADLSLEDLVRRALTRLSKPATVTR